MTVKSLLFVAPALRGGGAERVLVTLANRFCKLGYDVSFVLTLDNEIQYDVDPNIKITFNAEGKSVVKQVRFLQSVLKSNENATAVSFFTFQNMYLLAAGLGLRNRIIVSERNDPAKTLYRKKWAKSIRKFLYSTADKLVFQTEEAKLYFPKKIADKGLIIGNPIRDDIPTAYSGNREKVFVAFSRLNKQKNIPMMLRAMKLVIEKYPEYILRIYGKGEEQGGLENLANELDIEKNVCFMGFSSNVLEECKTATAFLSSSDYEGLSNSMLESMAIGLPCICTDCPCGGARAYIDNYKNGILVPVNDYKTMASAIIELIENPGLQEKLSKNATGIRNTLSLEKIISQWEQII